MAKTATVSDANPAFSRGDAPRTPGAPLRGTKDLTELFKPWCWCPLRGTENLTALQDPVLVAPARGKETSAAAIVSCAATACSPTSARSQ